MLYVGEWSEREQWHLLHSLLVFSQSLCYPQANWALLVLFPKWVGLWMFWTLWVSPRNSPVRLGVSPTAASTPTGVFSQCLRLYFPVLEPWVPWSVTWSTSCCLASQLQLCPPCSTMRHLAGSASCHLAESRLCPSCRSG